jgi:hypothetical protein
VKLAVVVRPFELAVSVYEPAFSAVQRGEHEVLTVVDDAVRTDRILERGLRDRDRRRIVRRDREIRPEVVDRDGNLEGVRSVHAREDLVGSEQELAEAGLGRGRRVRDAAVTPWLQAGVRVFFAVVGESRGFVRRTRDDREEETRDDRGAEPR